MTEVRPEEILRRIVPPFDADAQIKRAMSSCFYQDGVDLLELVLQGDRSTRAHRSYQAKLFVNLRMAIECFLKSMIISLSDQSETPEQAYNCAKKSGHDLVTLLNKVRDRTKGKTPLIRKSTKLLVRDLDRLGVGLRYKADVTAALLAESFYESVSMTGQFSSTVGSIDWLRKVLEHSRYLSEKTLKIHSSRFSRHKAMLGTDRGPYENRLIAFMKATKIRWAKRRPPDQGPV